MGFSWTGIILNAVRVHAIAPGATGESAKDFAHVSSGSSAKPPPPGVLDELANAVNYGRAALSAFLDLAALETRRASDALMWIVALAGIAGVCIVAAWLGFLTIVAMWAISLGVPPLLAGGGVVLANVGLAFLSISAGIRMSHDLLFSATRRTVAGKLPVKPQSP